MTEKKLQELSKDDGLKLLAMFTIAHSYYRKMREFEVAMAKMLKADGTYMNWVSDLLYEEAIPTVDAFYTALEMEGFVVIEDAPKGSDE